MSVVFKNLSVAAMNTVTTAQVLVTATTYCESFIIMADDSNTGYCYIGPSDVDTTTGYRLGAGQDLPVSIDFGGAGSFIDLSQIYWMTDTTTNGIRVSYLERSN